MKLYVFKPKILKLANKVLKVKKRKFVFATSVVDVKRLKQEVRAKRLKKC